MLGGEITKVILVRKEVTAQEGIASVLIAKLAESFAKVLFILTGIFLIFSMLDVPSIMEAGLLIAFVILVLTILAFWVLQRKGLLGSLINVLEKTPLPSRLIVRLRQQTEVLDEHMRTYHRSQLGTFWRAVCLHLVRSLLDLIQIQLILFLMGVSGGFFRCFYISAFSALVSALFFFVPGRLGAQEGGKVLIAKVLGMTAAQGVTLGIVSRLAQIIWSLLGLVVLLLWKKCFQDKDTVEARTR